LTAKHSGGLSRLIIILKLNIYFQVIENPREEYGSFLGAVRLFNAHTLYVLLAVHGKSTYNVGSQGYAVFRIDSEYSTIINRSNPLHSNGFNYSLRQSGFRIAVIDPVLLDHIPQGIYFTTLSTQNHEAVTSPTIQT